MKRASRTVRAVLVISALLAPSTFAPLNLAHLCAFAPLHSWTLLAQQSRDQAAKPQPGPAGTGVLSGVVTSEDGARPVRNAYLVLLGIGTGIVKVSSSDGDGRFSFVNLPADRYTLGASKPPYLGTVAGARRPGRSGTPIAVADGQKISNVAVRMPMGASISGFITDERGLPAGNRSVAIQQVRIVNGERTFVSVAGARSDTYTDERGRYRIYGLLPGEYVVAAIGGGVVATARSLSVTEVDAALRGAGAPATTPTATSSTQPAPLQLIGRPAPVYYPGTTRASNAMPVSLATGEERINIDFKLETVQTAKVEGVVVGVDGQPVSPASVSLRTSVASVLSGSAAVRTFPDGRFSFSNVTPGTYAVVASGAPAGPNSSSYAMASVEVNGADVQGVQLTMRPLLSLSGRMEFRGAGQTPALAGRRIPVRVINALSGPAPNVSPTTDTGAFTMAGVVPGAYVIGAPLSFGPTTDSMTWALDSVIADGKDITDLPFEITPETLPKEVVVTYSDRFQELNGKLSRADGSPVSEYTIVVFPQEKAYWITQSRRIVVTRPGTDGRFTLSGAGPTTLPAGKYYLAAVTDIDRNEQFDSSFLASIVPAAAQITLQPGEKKVQDLIVK